MRPLLPMLALLSGCADLSLRTEYEHVSHPTARNEDVIDQANVLLRATRDGWYVEGGAGLNLRDRNGGGFYGPIFTGTLRFGREIKIFRGAR